MTVLSFDLLQLDLKIGIFWIWIRLQFRIDILLDFAVGLGIIDPI